MDAARSKILPVEAHSGSNQVYYNNTTKLLPQLYMLNLNNNNNNNQLRNSSETTANADSLTSTSQLISSMLQATTATTNSSSSIPTNPSIETATSTLTFTANNVTHHQHITTASLIATTTTTNQPTTLISSFSTIDLLIVTVLITLILVSIIGNCLVCVAIFTDRRLRKLGNAFIVSLAIADLFVSCLVMTFALCNDLMNYWIFGDWFCDVWISFDIMCCTASILNLCAISLDRFIHIKDCLLYNQWMTRKVAISAVIIIWFISALVSFVPINLGWHKPDYHFGSMSSSSSSSSSSISSLVSSVKQIPLVGSSHQHQYRYQQQQQHHNHHRPTRNRRRAPNKSNFGAFQLQFQHSMSVPSGTLITTSEKATNNGFRFRESTKLDYSSTAEQHVKFPSPFNNNNEQQTAKEPSIEPIENQSSPYLMTTTIKQSQLANHPKAPITIKSSTNHNNSNQSSKLEDSLVANFDHPTNKASQINRTGRVRKRRRRRKRDLVSSNNGNNEKKEKKQDSLLNLDSSGFISERHPSSSSSYPTISGKRGSLLLPGQQQTASPQSNKVEFNPLDRSQIEPDPPKAWLLELEQEAARKATSSSSKAAPSSSSSNTSRRQLNLPQPSSAALKLSRLPELSDEDKDSNGYREDDVDDDDDHHHDHAANNNIDLIGKLQPIIQEQTQPVLTSTVTPTPTTISTDSIYKLSHPNIQSEQQSHPQLPVCILTLTPTYAVISSTISFYIPCIIMLGLYTKLFACARKHVRNIQAISKAPAPISVRTAAAAATTATITTTNTSQRSSPGTSDALARHPSLELENLAKNGNENNKKDCKSSRCNRQHPHRRFHRMPKISMLECNLPAASPIKTWLKFGRKQQQQQQQQQLQGETGGRLEEIGKNYSNAQLHDKSRSKKDSILSHRNSAKELALSNESSLGNDELVELARFTMSNKASSIPVSSETPQKEQSKSQKQLTETPCKPDNNLASSDISNNDQQRPSLSSIKTQQDRKQQQQQQQHRNAAEEKHSEVAKRMQMPQLDHEKQLPDEKNGKNNNSRKSLISSEVERMATLALAEELVEEELPFLANPQEVNNNNNNNNKRTRSLKQPTTCTSQLPLNSTKMINFSNQTNYQHQQQQQQQQQQSGQLATHKAAITLGIIMGTFLFCWVPFFCLNITKAFCVDCIPSSVFRFFTWLGYANSALNPIIYGIHNSEFRCAFNRIFFKHLNIKNSRYYLNRRFSYDLRQQSVHNNHSGSQKSFRGKAERQKSGTESKQSFKSCKAEALA